MSKTATLLDDFTNYSHQTATLPEVKEKCGRSDVESATESSKCSFYSQFEAVFLQVCQKCGSGGCCQVCNTDILKSKKNAAFK